MAQKKQEGPRILKYPNCLYNSEIGCLHPEASPCITCGFDRFEDERRKTLPLRYDRRTRTERKFVGVPGILISPDNNT